MKKVTTLLAGVAIAAVTVIPAFSSLPMVKQCKDLGITQIKGCASCHTSKNTKEMSDKDLNEIGKWLMEQKAAKKADKCDMAWLKDYPGFK